MKITEIPNGFKICITNLVATYDMGIQYSVITSQGASTELGNFGSWPLYYLPLDRITKEEINNVRYGLIKSKEQFFKLSFLGKLLKYNTIISGSYDLEENVEQKIYSKISMKIKELDEGKIDKKLYFYVAVEHWLNEVNVFYTKEDFEDFLLETWGANVIPYQDMNEEEFDQYYKMGKRKKWKNNFPMRNIKNL